MATEQEAQEVIRTMQKEDVRNKNFINLFAGYFPQAKTILFFLKTTRSKSAVTFDVMQDFDSFIRANDLEQGFQEEL